MEQVVHNNPMPTQSAPQTNSQPNPMMKKVNTGSSGKNKYLMVVVAVLVVLAGVAIGWKMSGSSIGSGGLGQTLGSENVAPGAKQTSTEAGIESEDCKDNAEGTLEEGGIDGEGTHHLVRSADASKNVYLGSTVVDLQSYIGKKVKVTGQTISGKKAGWLMDVCKIKITE
ncbi:hypothetical protein KW795_00950 [Candidatus Microgenomates bacterium]|nr:hypothetical protein [Candidatus Microgenomates bacterium]